VEVNKNLKIRFTISHFAVEFYNLFRNVFTRHQVLFVTAPDLFTCHTHHVNRNPITLRLEKLYRCTTKENSHISQVILWLLSAHRTRVVWGRTDINLSQLAVQRKFGFYFSAAERVGHRPSKGRMQRGVVTVPLSFPQTTANNGTPRTMKTVTQRSNPTVTESVYGLNFYIIDWVCCIWNNLWRLLLNSPLLGSWAKIPVYGGGWEPSCYALENAIAQDIQCENLRFCCNKHKGESHLRATRYCHSLCTPATCRHHPWNASGEQSFACSRESGSELASCKHRPSAKISVLTLNAWAGLEKKTLPPRSIWFDERS